MYGQLTLAKYWSVSVTLWHQIDSNSVYVEPIVLLYQQLLTGIQPFDRLQLCSTARLVTTIGATCFQQYYCTE